MNEIAPENRDTQTLRNIEAAELPATTQHRYIQAATSDNTRRTYQSTIRHFGYWPLKPW